MGNSAVSGRGRPEAEAALIVHAGREASRIRRVERLVGRDPTRPNSGREIRISAEKPLLTSCSVHEYS